MVCDGKCVPAEGRLTLRGECQEQQETSKEEATGLPNVRRKKGTRRTSSIIFARAEMGHRMTSGDHSKLGGRKKRIKGDGGRMERRGKRNGIFFTRTGSRQTPRETVPTGAQ